MNARPLPSGGLSGTLLMALVEGALVAALGVGVISLYSDVPIFPMGGARTGPSAGIGLGFVAFFAILLGGMLASRFRAHSAGERPAGIAGQTAVASLSAGNSGHSCGRERDFRELVEALPANILCFDRDGRVVYANPQFERDTEIPLTSLLGRRLTELQNSQDTVHFELAVRNVLATGNAAEHDLRLSTSRGTRARHMSMVARRDGDKRIEGALAIGPDVAGLKRGEAHLTMMRFVMDRVAEAALLIDEQARIVYANRNASLLLGYDIDELQRSCVADLREGFDASEWVEHWRVLREQGSLSYETVQFSRTRREILLEINATYIELGGQGYDLAMGRDISERRRMESAQNDALREAERLARVKSEFLANMSHEIRTPLNAVLGIAQLGLRANREQKAQSQFAAILDAGQLLLSLVDDILDFSKIDAGKLVLEEGWVDTARLVDRVVQLIAVRAYAKGLNFRVEEANDLPLGFFGDNLRLAQVLVNLLSNAVKFTETGEVSLRLDREQDNLVFTVSDTGIGMDTDQLGRLFTPFEQADGSTTRRFGGTGLGLAISKRLMDMMGGTISADGQPDRGMTFRVRLPVRGMKIGAAPRVTGRIWMTGPGCALPLAEELASRGVEVLLDSAREALAGPEGLLMVPHADLAREKTVQTVRHALDAGRRVVVITPPGGVTGIPEELLDRVDLLDWPPRVRHLLRILSSPRPAHQSRPAEAQKRLQGVRVLAAEDNDLNRMILEELLLMEGARVESVANGRLLVERVRQGAGDFDVIMTDVSMPEMDGNEAARLIRELAPGLPIIGLTAHVLKEERDRCLASGMAAHLGKPAQLDELVRVIRELLSSGNAPLDQGMPSETPATEPSPQADASAPVVDWPALDQDFAGKKALVWKFMNMLVANHAETPSQLRELAAAGAREDMVKLAHNLKGMAGNLRANRVRDQAAVLVKALRGNDQNALDGTESLAVEMENLLREAASRLAEKDGFFAGIA